MRLRTTGLSSGGQATGGRKGVSAMEKERVLNERRRDILASALVAAGCCTIIAVVLWVPVARAEVILSGLPGVISIITTRFRSRQQMSGTQVGSANGREDSRPEA